jgi:hypothetical protein
MSLEGDAAVLEDIRSQFIHQLFTDARVDLRRHICVAPYFGDHLNAEGNGARDARTALETATHSRLDAAIANTEVN